MPSSLWMPLQILLKQRICKSLLSTFSNMWFIPIWRKLWSEIMNYSPCSVGLVMPPSLTRPLWCWTELQKDPGRKITPSFPTVILTGWYYYSWEPWAVHPWQNQCYFTAATFWEPNGWEDLETGKFTRTGCQPEGLKGNNRSEEFRVVEFVSRKVVYLLRKVLFLTVHMAVSPAELRGEGGNLQMQSGNISKLDKSAGSSFGGSRWPHRAAPSTLACSEFLSLQTRP